MQNHDKLAVVDFGGQYAHLIAAKIRRAGVLAEILDGTEEIERFLEYKGVILSGSPALSSQSQGQDYNPAIYDLPIPLLGLCFGHQELVKRYGGKVEHTRREYGPAVLHIERESPLFKGLESKQIVWMSHGDSVVSLPDGFVELGYTMHQGKVEGRNAAVGHQGLGRYGLQFHPEVDDTTEGQAMLANFALDICGCRPTWSMKSYAQETIEKIRDAAMDRKVLLLVSGGVDSTVCAWLLNRAVGPQRLHLLHIDNGLMRRDESRQVLEELRMHDISRNIHFVDATGRFLKALQDVIDPEKKRHIIGETFIHVLTEEANKLSLSQFVMAQGTIYPDTIETGGTRRSSVIKTHHNRVPLVREMIEQGRMLEPLRELYKVEVRELGSELGIPRQSVDRHPFPGPGLGVRLLASDGKIPEGYNEEIELLVRRAAEHHGFEARLLPARSVGVKADLRSYELCVLLFAQGYPFRSACEATTMIVNQVAGVNRCVLMSGKAPESLCAVKAHVSAARLDVLREADHLVRQALHRHKLMDLVWQCPVVMVPMKADDLGSELVVIRAVLSERAMTARPAELPEEMIEEVAPKILGLEGVWGLGLDVTPKPPGTIEWE